MEATRSTSGRQAQEEHSRRPHYASGAIDPAAERWIAAIGGAALLAAGMGRRGVPRWALLAGGGALLVRAARGFLPVRDLANARAAATPTAIQVEEFITIARAREPLFQFWRSLENLPRFMKHLQSVRETDALRSHWTARAPLGRAVEWDAEIVAEKKNALISWRSVEGSNIESRGSVRFVRAPENRGTEVYISLEYHPPAGRLGARVARLLGQDPAEQVREDLRRFKSLMEAGQAPTTDGQPGAK